MTFRSKLAIFTSALILASSSFAAQELCPSIDLIKAEGISMAEQISPSLIFLIKSANTIQKPIGAF